MTSAIPLSPSIEVPRRIRPALAALLEAHQYAQQTISKSWEFALELAELRQLGLTTNDFRWLVRSGLVEHQREITREHQNGRVFQPTGDLTFCRRTCFVLTAEGVAVASRPWAPDAGTGPASYSQKKDPLGEALVQSQSGPPPGYLGSDLCPKWNSQERELLLGTTLVKRFKYAAANQEMVLSAFEEEGWPSRIDDPLPPEPKQDPKRRLNDTIKCLNRKQTNRLLHFRGDGTGQRVVWERA